MSAFNHFRKKFSNWTSPRKRASLRRKVRPQFERGERGLLEQACGSDSAGCGFAEHCSGLSSPDAPVAPGQPEVKDYQVSFDGDVAHGQFLTQIAGKDVWVTLSGHLGSKDGYATFDPTEFKVGDLSVPVSLVNDALQKKLAEQRDRLKLPDNVGGMKVENGELVMTQK